MRKCTLWYIVSETLGSAYSILITYSSTNENAYFAFLSRWGGLEFSIWNILEGTFFFSFCRCKLCHLSWRFKGYLSCSFSLHGPIIGHWLFKGTGKTMKRLLYMQVDLTLKTQQKHNKFKSENFRKKKVSFKPYYLENLKSRVQTMQNQMRWLIISHLIYIYPVCNCNYFVPGTKCQVFTSHDTLFSCPCLYWIQ